MKILWIINTILPYPAEKINVKPSVFGGWLNSLLYELELNEEITEIAIISVCDIKARKKFTNKKTTYYLIPCKNKIKYDKQVEKEQDIIIREFKPDLIHIHGTEYPYSLSMVNTSQKNNIKNVVSIQGLISKCGEFNNYFAGIEIKELWGNISLRDIIKRDIFPLQNRELKKRGKYEIECLKKADCIIGRTSWDKANVFAITEDNKYKKCNESLRETFYNKNWNLDTIEKHSIFISQASYPLKGFHKMVIALSILKNKYPNIKVYVAGVNATKYGEVSLKEKLKLTGYGKYLRRLIKKYNLRESIVFTGLLNEEQMVNRLLKSHIFVQTSSIENSPNSLGEAMLLGMPCVASYVGGTADMLRDKVEGFLYPFNDESMLAKYISDIFEDDNLAVSLGKNAKKHAINTHDRLKNTDCMVEIYKELIK